MRQFFSLLTLLGVFFGTYKLYEFQASRTERATIRIGATLPLSGKTAKIGLTNQDAINLAFKDWSSRRTRYKYQIFYLDDQTSPEQGILNANNMMKHQKVNAILSQWTPVAEAIAPLAEQNKIIHFTCAVSDKANQGEYNFNHYLSYHTDKFTTDFMAATNKQPASCTSNLYDAVNLLIFAYENTLPSSGKKAPTNEDVIKTLHRLSNHQTASGAIFISSDGIVKAIEAKAQ